MKRLSRQFRGDEEVGRTEQTTVLRQPLRIDRIELWHNITRKHPKKAKQTDYPIVEFSTEEDAKEKQTIVTVCTRREPLTALTIETTSSNFSRAAAVQVPVTRGVATDWVEVGGTTVSAVRFRGFEQEKLIIRFPEQRQAEYRIVVSNQDNPPLEITGVAADGNVYRVMFFAGRRRTLQVLLQFRAGRKTKLRHGRANDCPGQGFPAGGQRAGTTNRESGLRPKLRIPAHQTFG